MEPANGPIPPAGGAGGWIFALAGGLAGALAFEPIGWRALIPLAPLGFFLAARGAATPRSAALRVLAGSYVFDMFAISWLLTTGRYNPFSYAGVPLLALYVALYSGLAAYITRRWFAPLPPLAQYFAFAALWLLFEWWRTLGRLSMPFTLLAHAWAPWPSAIQTAEFLGELGVSLNILLLGAMLLAFARMAVIPLRPASGAVAPRWLAVCDDDKATLNKAALTAGNLFAIAFGMLVFSGFRLADWNARLAAAKPEAKLRVAAVQPVITQDVKLAS